MKKVTIFICSFLLVLGAKAQTKINPVIKSYGTVFEIPKADHKPDQKINYKIIVELTENASKPDSLNEYLEAIATLINLHGAEGVPKENIHVVVVLRKMATYAVFANDAYKEKFKADNPNSELIKALHDAGTEFYVCGQTMLRRNLTAKTFMPEVKVASSGLTALTTFQLQGYALIKF